MDVRIIPESRLAVKAALLTMEPNMVEREKPSGWALSISGYEDHPSDKRIILAKDEKGKRVLLEIVASGFPTDPDALDSAVRQSLRDALADFQQAVNSPSRLPLHRYP